MAGRANDIRCVGPYDAAVMKGRLKIELIQVSRCHTLIQLFVASLLLSGCSQIIRPQLPQSKATSSPIFGVQLGFEPITIAIPHGTLVGGKALNPKSSYQREYRYGQSFRLDTAELTFSLKDELVQQGYQQAHGASAKRWRIRASVVKVVHNIFGSQPALGWSEAQVSVDWHLTGPRDVRVTTVGIASARKHTRASVFQAWRKAIRAFGGHTRVVAVLQADVGAGTDRPREATSNGIQRLVNSKPAPTNTLNDKELRHNVAQSVVHVLFRDRQSIGVVISETGLIVTALSAVQGTPSVVIVNSMGQRISGRIVAIDPEGKTALISAKLVSSSAIPFRLSSDTLGERILIVGPKPDGARSRFTAGGFITSTPPGELDTNVSVDATFLGAPIVDEFGRLLGVVTEHKSTSGSSARGTPTSTIFSGLNITVL